MIDVKDLLYEICEDEKVFEEDIDLVETGLLDSYAIIEFLARLEDEGYEIHITQIDRNLLHTAKGIEKMLGDAK